VETDTRRWKLGDGTTGWNGLPYAGGDGRTVNVADFGAKGDGSDDTTAIEAAAAAAFTNSNPKPLLFPPGTYLYNGAGITPATGNVHVQGAGAKTTTINLGASSKFLTFPGAASLLIDGINFVGGTTVIHDTTTSTNVTGVKKVTNNEFTNYTVGAIRSDAADSPYWQIQSNLFRAANDTATIGILLSGDNASSSITDNAFEMNRVHIKLAGNAGAAVRLERNDLIRYGATSSNPRIDVWIVPAAGAGDGFTARDNKFGNENQLTGDFRVLFADENTGSGTSHADRWPATTTSTGHVNGHTYTGNNQGGNAGQSTVPAFITTYTNTTRDLRVSEQGFSGTPPVYVVNYVNPPTSGDTFMTSAIIGPVRYNAIGQTYQTAASNVSWVRVIDPTDQLQAGTLPFNTTGGGNGSGFIGAFTGNTAAPNRSGGATATAVTDALGGTNAAEVTYAGSGDFAYYGLSGVVTTLPLWVEFELKAGTTTPLTFVDVVGMASGVTRHQRRITVPAAGWMPYRFPMWKVDALTQLHFRPTTAAGSVQIGRVRAYHAREPLPMDLILPAVPTATTAPAAGGGAALPATPAGYVTVYINGTARKVAYY
jgi:hypothetical protein